MRLAIKHTTTYRYDPEAARVALRLKLYPTHFGGQRPVRWSISVNGEAPSTPIVGPYGDEESIWLCRAPVDQLEIVAEGVVETVETAGVLTEWRMAARPNMMLRPTPLTEANDAIQALAEAVAGVENGLDQAHALSALVSERIVYAPGETTAHTTAAEALAAGKGVCQDHAHVMIAAARSLGAPARYVSGYLSVHDGETTEGDTAETHGWAEVWVPALGWIGFDPANEVCPTERYVRLASGLDAADAAPIRGAVVGETEEVLHAEVEIHQQ